MHPQLVIDLDAIVANYKALKAMASGARTAAVVKSDAYGLGLIPVSKALQAAGCDVFMVCWLNEGAALREALGPHVEIWLMHGVEANQQDECVALNLIPVLNCDEQVEAWCAVYAERPAVLHVDTGMNRLGLPPKQQWALPKFNLHALMSHLACAAQPDAAMNTEQLQQLRRIAAEMNLPADVPLSLANTGGVLLGSDWHLGICRTGIGLYGGVAHPKLQSVIELSTSVLQVRTLAAGESVGYNALWHAPRDGVQIATIAAGYADGWRLDGGWVVIRGQRAPMVGEISMDLIAVDVTGMDVQLGDTVMLANSQLTLPELQHLSGRSSYELLTNIGPRFERQYRGGAQ